MKLQWSMDLCTTSIVEQDGCHMALQDGNEDRSSCSFQHRIRISWVAATGVS